MSILRWPWEKRDYRGALDSGLVYYLLRNYGKGRVLDQFPGGGVVREVSEQLGLTYEATDFPEEDARQLRRGDGVYSTVLSHIPYWNAKKYSDSEKDLSNCPTYEGFLEGVFESIGEAVRVLATGGHLVFITGDYRRKKKYYPIHAHVLNHVERRHGNMELIDILVWELTATSTPFLGTPHMIGVNFCMIWKKLGEDLTEVF